MLKRYTDGVTGGLGEGSTKGGRGARIIVHTVQSGKEEKKMIVWSGNNSLETRDVPESSLNPFFFSGCIFATKGHLKDVLEGITYLPIMLEFIKGVGDNPSWDTNRPSLK